MDEGPHYIPGTELAEDLPEQSDKFRSDLARAARWRFYKGDPGKPMLQLPDLNAAQSLIASLEEFDEVRDAAGADALVNAGSFNNPWHEPIIKLGRAVGLPFDEALMFAKELESRGFVEIVPANTGRGSPGEESFGEPKHWAYCEKKDGEQSEGK